MNAHEAERLAALVQEQWLDRVERSQPVPPRDDAGADVLLGKAPNAYWPLGAKAPSATADRHAGVDLIGAKSVGVSLLVGFTLRDTPGREYLLHFDLTEMPVELDAAANSIYEALFLLTDPARWEQSRARLLTLSPEVELLPVRGA